MIVSKAVATLLLLATALGTTSCGSEPPAGNAAEAEDVDIAVDGAANTAEADAAGQATVNSTSSNSVAVANDAGESCRRVEAAEASSFAGLELAGTSGSYRFYARGRELLCSEAGAGGRGECEIPGSAEVRVEGPGGTYGFRNPAGSPAILTYSPEGVSCTAR